MRERERAHGSERERRGAKGDFGVCLGQPLLEHLCLNIRARLHGTERPLPGHKRGWVNMHSLVVKRVHLREQLLNTVMCMLKHVEQGDVCQL